MQSALSSVEGVDDVSVDFAAKTATVQVGGPLHPDDLIGAIEGAGFGATIPE